VKQTSVWLFNFVFVHFGMLILHLYLFLREQVEDLQKEIQKIEADYRRQVNIF